MKKNYMTSIFTYCNVMSKKSNESTFNNENEKLN
jgi:hypothetical protein